MPRRRGKERRPKQVAIDLARLREKYPHLTFTRDMTFSSYVDGGKVVQSVPAGTMLCHHMQPWTTCTVCSKPVRR